MFRAAAGAAIITSVARGTASDRDSGCWAGLGSWRVHPALLKQVLTDSAPMRQTGRRGRRSPERSAWPARAEPGRWPTGPTTELARGGQAVTQRNPLGVNPLAPGSKVHAAHTSQQPGRGVSHSHFLTPKSRQNFTYTATYQQISDGAGKVRSRGTHGVQDNITSTQNS